MPSDGGRKNPWVVAAEYTSLAITLPAATAVGWIIGYMLDRWLGTNFLQIVFVILGIAAGFLQLIRQLQKDRRQG